MSGRQCMRVRGRRPPPARASNADRHCERVARPRSARNALGSGSTGSRSAAVWRTTRARPRRTCSATMARNIAVARPWRRHSGATPRAASSSTPSSRVGRHERDADEPLPDDGARGGGAAAKALAAAPTPRPRPPAGSCEVQAPRARAISEVSAMTAGSASAGGASAAGRGAWRRTARLARRSATSPRARQRAAAPAPSVVRTSSTVRTSRSAAARLIDRSAGRAGVILEAGRQRRVVPARRVAGPPRPPFLGEQPRRLPVRGREPGQSPRPRHDPIDRVPASARGQPAAARIPVRHPIDQPRRLTHRRRRQREVRQRIPDVAVGAVLADDHVRPERGGQRRDDGRGLPPARPPARRAARAARSPKSRPRSPPPARRGTRCRGRATCPTRGRRRSGRPGPRRAAPGRRRRGGRPGPRTGPADRRGGLGRSARATSL